MIKTKPEHPLQKFTLENTLAARVNLGLCDDAFNKFRQTFS